MALYEGIALIQEKQAVVLDLGYDYTKFGFTGEPAPRCIIRSEFWCATERRFKRVHDYKTPEELYDNLVQMLHLLYFRHVLVNPKERKVVVVESLLTPTLFRETLAKVLFNHYEVSGVVWADSPRLCALTLGTPITLIVSIGAREAEVAAVVHASVVLRALQSQPLAARAVHDELARLLDDDNGQELHLTDEIIEVVHASVVLRALQSQPLAARAVHDELARLLDDDNGQELHLTDEIIEDINILLVHASVVLRALQSQPLAARAIHDELARLLDDDNGQELHLTDEIIEDIKVKTCFVIPRARALQWCSPSPPTPAPPVQYPVAGRSAITVSGRTREMAAEPLFARDNEWASLPDIVLQCIMLCPIDARRALAENILVTGGTAAMLGLRSRLAQELAALVKLPPYNERLYMQTFKFHTAPAHENTTAWVGGALGGAADAGAARALPRDVWARSPRLRDWVCLQDNTPPGHPHRDYQDI